ncbi:MAG: hypothetical protein OXE99_11965, partial [Cellvibrionales bacterium]|nr:hypothetical protein [Cellvibrionales bacterium]
MSRLYSNGLITFCIMSLSCFSLSISTSDPQQQDMTPSQQVIDPYAIGNVDNPYYWLEKITAHDTQKWVREQSVSACETIENIPFFYAIDKRIRELLPYQAVYQPKVHGDYVYFESATLNKYNMGYNTIIKRKHIQTGVEEEYLKLSDIEKRVNGNITELSFSPDGSNIAVLIANKDYSNYTVYFLDTKTNNFLENHLDNIKNPKVAWKNNAGIFYIAPPAKTPLTPNSR